LPDREGLSFCDFEYADTNKLFRGRVRLNILPQG